MVSIEGAEGRRAGSTAGGIRTCLTSHAGTAGRPPGSGDLLWLLPTLNPESWVARKSDHPTISSTVHPSYHQARTIYKTLVKGMLGGPDMVSKSASGLQTRST